MRLERLEKYAISLRKSLRTSRRSRESGKEKVLEVQDDERKGPQGSSRAQVIEEPWRNKVPFFVRKKSARLRGSQVIEEPCVGGEGSSSIRLSPLYYSLVSSLHCLIPTLPIFYRFLPDFSDFLAGVLPGVSFTS